MTSYTHTYIHTLSHSHTHTHSHTHAYRLFVQNSHNKICSFLFLNHLVPSWWAVMASLVYLMTKGHWPTPASFRSTCRFLLLCFFLIVFFFFQLWRCHSVSSCCLHYSLHSAILSWNKKKKMKIKSITYWNVFLSVSMCECVRLRKKNLEKWRGATRTGTLKRRDKVCVHWEFYRIVPFKNLLGRSCIHCRFTLVWFLPHSW